MSLRSLTKRFFFFLSCFKAFKELNWGISKNVMHVNGHSTHYSHAFQAYDWTHVTCKVCNKVNMQYPFKHHTVYNRTDILLLYKNNNIVLIAIERIITNNSADRGISPFHYRL